MWIVWALVGVGVTAIALGIWLFVRAHRRRKGRVFGILAGVVLILAAIVFLACYLPVFVVPDVTAESAVFHQPAPVDRLANVYFLSSAEMDYGGPSFPTDTLVAVAARSGAIRWQRALAGTRSQLAVAGDIAYVATFLPPPDTGNVELAAYRGADGVLLWQTSVADSLSHAVLAASGDAVYLLTGVATPGSPVTLVALRASDGTQVWSAESNADANTYITTLVAAPDAVYLSATTGLQVYRSSDGEPLWTSDQHLSARVVVGAGFAVLPSESGGFSVVHASDGSAICQVGGKFVATLDALDGDSLYLAGLIQGSPSGAPPFPSAVYAYDASTCTPRWHTGYVASDLIAGGGAVYMLAADSGTVTGLRPADGKALWHSDAVTSTLSGMGWRFSTQPALLGATLFATSGIMGGGIHVFGGYGWVHLYAFGGASGFEYWHVPIGHRTRFSSHLVF